MYDVIHSSDGILYSDLLADGWDPIYNEFYSDRTLRSDVNSWEMITDDYLMLGGYRVSDGAVLLAGVITPQNFSTTTTGNQTNTFAETSLHWYNKEFNGTSVGFSLDPIVSLLSLIHI